MQHARSWRPRHGALRAFVGAAATIAIAFGTVTVASATEDLGAPGTTARGIEEECREGCSSEEKREHFWGEGFSEYLIEKGIEWWESAPPPRPRTTLTWGGR